MIAFLTGALLLVTAFFAYHLYLILCGTTSYESYKWTLLYKRLAAEQEAEGSSTSSADAPRGASLWSVARGLVGSRKLQGMPANAYDRGVMRNLQDALIPPGWAGSLAVLRPKQM